MNRWPIYSTSCIADVTRLLKSGVSLSAYRANPRVGVGPKEGSYAWQAERALEKLSGAKHAVAVNSGTAALHAALVALEVRGREVVTSPYTFSATVSAILLAGGTPRFADVDPTNFCITPETVTRVLARKTAAILPVDLFGYVQDKSGFARFGLPVITDACQAVGAHTLTKHEVAAVYSFNGMKNVPAGEGGALVTNDAKLAERARLFCNHAENFGTRDVGYNYRMQELVACLTLHGLSDVKKRNEERRAFADAVPFTVYGDGSSYRHASMHRNHAYYCVPMRYLRKRPSRATFVKRLNAAGISAGNGYIDPPLHHYAAFRKYARGRLPVVDRLSSETLVLFYEPWRGAEGGRKAAEAIRRAVKP